MSQALDTWRKKLDYFQQQEAIVADPAQKFALAENIEEAKAKIAELEATTVPQPSSALGAFRADISRIIKHAPAELIGRETETKFLFRCLGQGGSRRNEAPPCSHVRRLWWRGENSHGGKVGGGACASGLAGV